MVFSQIERQFGKGAVMKLGEAAHMNIDTVSTGALGLDIALGVGACREGVLLKYSVLNHRVKPPLRFM